MKIGKVSESVLKRSVLRQLKTVRHEVLNGAGSGRDCAVFSFHDMPVMSCVQEGAAGTADDAGCHEGSQTVRFTMGRLIQKCVNNLAASGAEPVAAMVTLILPPDTEESYLKKLMAEAEEKCAELSVAIAGGQTRVMEGISVPVAVVTGIGKGRTGGGGFKPGIALPGQDVVVSKWIGLEGTAYLAEHSRERLCARYPAYMVEEAAGFHRFLSVLPEAYAAMESGVCAMHDVSEGGIFTALWELAEASGVGLEIDLKKLPIRQETVEICEFCGVNPYELLSGGCMVMTARDGDGLVNFLQSCQIPASVVGRVTQGRERILRNEEDIRYLDRPAGDELYRFLEYMRREKAQK